MFFIPIVSFEHLELAHVYGAEVFELGLSGLCLNGSDYDLNLDQLFLAIEMIQLWGKDYVLRCDIYPSEAELKQLTELLTNWPEHVPLAIVFHDVAIKEIWSAAFPQSEWILGHLETPQHLSGFSDYISKGVDQFQVLPKDLALIEGAQSEWPQIGVYGMSIGRPIQYHLTDLESWSQKSACSQDKASKSAEGVPGYTWAFDQFGGYLLPEWPLWPDDIHGMGLKGHSMALGACSEIGLALLVDYLYVPQGKSEQDTVQVMNELNILTPALKHLNLAPEHTFLGQVIETGKGCSVVKVTHRIGVGDEVFWSKLNLSGKVDTQQLQRFDGEIVSEVKPGEFLILREPLENFAFLRKKKES